MENKYVNMYMFENLIIKLGMMIVIAMMMTLVGR